MKPDIMPKWEDRPFHHIRLFWAKLLVVLFYFTKQSRMTRTEIREGLKNAEEMKAMLKQRIKVRNQTGYTSVNQKEIH